MSMDDFANVLNSSNQLSTPYVPAVPSEQLSAAYRPLGLPLDPAYNSPPPGLESTLAAVDPTPGISSIQGLWDSVKSHTTGVVSSVEHVAEEGISTAYGTVKGVAKTVYGDVSSGVGTVFHDVSSPLTDTLKTGFWYAMLAVVVVGGALYFIGKTGAVKVAIPI